MDRYDIEKMWKTCFPLVDKALIASIVTATKDNDDDMILTVNDAEGRPMSSLLLQKKKMLFQGEELDAGYISFACTYPRYRGMGTMSMLLSDALNHAYNRGDALVALTPSASWLQYFYEREGDWSSTVFTLENNYTGYHHFGSEGYEDASSATMDEMFDAFSRLEREQGRCVMLHSRSDFDLAVRSYRNRGGNIFASRNVNTHSIEAIAVAVPDEYAWCVKVIMLAGESKEARRAVLSYISERYGDMRISISRPAPDDMIGNTRIASMKPSGMMRVVNPSLLFPIIERHVSDRWGTTLRLTDRLLPQNSGIYHLGKPSRGDADTIDFDITPGVLTKIIFSSKTIGDIINFPGTRPVMNMMVM